MVFASVLSIAVGQMVAQDITSGTANGISGGTGDDSHSELSVWGFL
jgi:hypothetical protein